MKSQSRDVVLRSSCDDWYRAIDVKKIIKSKDLEILILNKKLKTSEKKISIANAMLTKIETQLEQFGMQVDETKMFVENNNRKLKAENFKLAGQLKRMKK